MQRRAAAIYAVFFIVLGVASYSLIATAIAPTIAFQDPEYRLSVDDTFSVGGQQYTVADVQTTESEGGGHGGGGGVTHTAVFEWTVQESEYTESWENNSTVTLGDTDYRVLVPNESDPGEFTLREEINKTRILQNDPEADNETVTREGTEYVVLEESDGSASLVPADEYFPEPATQSYGEGEAFDRNGNETTVGNVTAETVPLTWQAPRTSTVEAGDRSNVTLGDQTYLAYFPSDDEVVLTQDYDSYQSQVATIDTYHERVNGLWGVSIVSSLVAVLLLGMAYMPSRY